MAYFYLDTDGSGASAPYGTWATAAQDIETALGAMSAGDTLFVQGAADDSVASSRTFTSPGTISNPCIVVGVVDGTTNTGTSVVTSDLAVTLPKIIASGGGSDITFAGWASWLNIHIESSDKVAITSGDIDVNIVNGKFTIQDDVVAATTGNAAFILTNSILETTAATAAFAVSQLKMFGGSILSTTAAPIIDVLSSVGPMHHELISVDISGRGTTALITSAGVPGYIVLRNCKTPAVFNLYSSAPTGKSSIECIGCSDTTSVAATDSIQDYQYQDAYGTVDLEVTAVRTGGADDDATGLFSYAMTPAASATLESSNATLKSPWMSVWVAGGSNTLTVYIANDSASTDYNEDEAWVEFYTPDVGDTAQYDQTFDAGDARLLDSTTAITDDTGSTWGTGANNHQTFSATVTTGYTGWAYARLHLAKRSATPDTLFLDPKIVVS